jgi:hypothetical protein
MARREWLEVVNIEAWRCNWDDPIPLHRREWFAADHLQAWRWNFAERSHWSNKFKPWLEAMIGGDFRQRLHMHGMSVMAELNWWVFVAQFMAPPIKKQMLVKVSDTIQDADLFMDGDTRSEEISFDAPATPMPVIVAHPCRCSKCKEETKNRRGDGLDEPQWPSFEC